MARYLNRELSWLDFNDRVLALAEDKDVPVLERAKFLAIFSQNLDEFFQVRVAGLNDQVAAGLGPTAPDGLNPQDQLRAIRERVVSLLERQGIAYLEGLAPALAEVGIVISDWQGLDEGDRAHLEEEFVERIFPVLTPLAVDPGHPFPYISNMSLNLAVLVGDPASSERRFARVKVPPLLPRFVAMPDGERFLPLEQVIGAHLPALFPGMRIEGTWPFRVTRNVDLALEEDEADDLLAAVELELRRRRFGRAVRLEVDATISEEVLELLVRELDLRESDVYVVAGPLDLSGLWAVHELERPELKDEAWVGVTQPGLATVDDEPVDLFAVLRERDVLVHHPYDSFTTSVEAFILQAAADPGVLAIKQTLYRTSGESPIVQALIDANEGGKQVVVLVELKARFDEQANIAWARALEEAGVHVVYGLVGLKTHTKTALIVRDEGGRMRRYCHIGTGNYNPRTARLYEDIGLFTSNPDVGADLSDLFNYLTGYSRHVEYRRLLVAPVSLRRHLLDLVAAEATQPRGTGRIIMKMNSLVDPSMIDALYEASDAGVSIDLIVRGICCLRPGVPGLSEHIRVRSVVGRYLEHSRIFAFGGGDRRSYYIGSADLMPRNLDRRVEAVVPVDDPELTLRLQEILDLNLEDDVLAWELTGDGAWDKVPTTRAISTHVALHQLAMERARRRRELRTESPGDPIQL
ncbi:MAG: RNA degradosome polyphosphate kinase [Acidimicrobiales bacterium]